MPATLLGGASASGCTWDEVCDHPVFNQFYKRRRVERSGPDGGVGGIGMPTTAWARSRMGRGSAGSSGTHMPLSSDSSSSSQG